MYFSEVWTFLALESKIFTKKLYSHVSQLRLRLRQEKLCIKFASTLKEYYRTCQEKICIFGFGG